VCANARGSSSCLCDTGHMARAHCEVTSSPISRPSTCLVTKVDKSFCVQGLLVCEGDRTRHFDLAVCHRVTTFKCSAPENDSYLVCMASAKQSRATRCQINSSRGHTLPKQQFEICCSEFVFKRKSLQAVQCRCEPHFGLPKNLAR
jgi:hypothetical protein